MMTKKTSNKIYFLAFFYSVAIVLFHWRWNSFGHIVYINDLDSFILKAFFWLAGKMGYVCLGFFFFFSAYWLYYKKDNLNIGKIAEKIKKLIVPYAAWSVIVALYFIITKDTVLYERNILYWVFCGPIVMPLWYILCVILFHITTPIFVRKKKEVTLCIILVVSLFSVLKSIGIVPNVIDLAEWWWLKNIFIFLPIYLLGLYIGRYHKEIIDKRTNTRGLVLMGVLLICFGLFVWWFLGETVLILGVLAINLGVWLLVDLLSLRTIPNIMKCNFYIYASHQQILIPIVSYISVKISEGYIISGIVAVILKIMQVISVIIICWLARLLLQKTLPRVDKILTGGR